eukprot:CAMPEP_0113872266 /NCGR_PEP_ID=MMETSP0780_2-20120614/3109_1 /TAXON_ID=652834 /ORGANISM="Palpitomonas bilix" /LENGTH=73 /DNA_ID=CAMNT_0000857761 /DNA_START=33 /DNA_END=250 /DNA_ORIENTATION=- /assembly_acc=CAM_ASM_000599
MTASKSTKITSICSYFDVDFLFTGGSGASVDGASKVNMTTSLEQKATHWKQTVFPLPFDMEVLEGDEVEVIIS